MRLADSLKLPVSATWVRRSAFPGPMTISPPRRMRIRGCSASFVLSESGIEPQTGEVESDHGNLGIYLLRTQQNGFCLLYTLDPPNR